MNKKLLIGISGFVILSLGAVGYFITNQPSSKNQSTTLKVDENKTTTTSKSTTNQMNPLPTTETTTSSSNDKKTKYNEPKNNGQVPIETDKQVPQSEKDKVVSKINQAFPQLKEGDVQAVAQQHFMSSNDYLSDLKNEMNIGFDLKMETLKVFESNEKNVYQFTIELSKGTRTKHVVGYYNTLMNHLKIVEVY